MASRRPAAKRPSTAPVGARLLWTLVLLAVAVLVYVIVAFSGAAPLPRSVASVADNKTSVRGPALVTGYYEMLPFFSNGNGMPPYAFAADIGPARHPSVRVQPTLADLRSFRVVAVIDTTTGDGSQWNPYVVHTLGSVPAFASIALIGFVVLATLLFWIAGYVALLMQRTASKSWA